jgi:hypothetical protein
MATMTDVRVIRRPRRSGDVARWLRERPSLAELRAAYPDEWKHVEEHVASLVRGQDPDRLRAWLADAARPPGAARPGAVGRGHARPRKVVVSEVIRRHMTIEAVRQAALRVETGVTGSRLRLGLVNGWIMQRLLFERGLRRKAVSWPAFRLVWPLLTQRRRLMPLVMPQGVYCFYARPLLRGLARIVGDRPCLEIAAGDGTLSRLLAEYGVRVTATDDHSWDADVHYDDSVARLDAVSALAAHRPEVVICSWPPPGNTFERQVFATRSVQTYVVVTARNESVAGNWDAYRRQTAFELTQDARLGRYVLPPMVDGTVLVFRRRAQGRRAISARSDQHSSFVRAPCAPNTYMSPSTPS